MSGLTVKGLISAAGMSSRMGDFKPLLDLAGKPLICRTVESLLSGGAQQVVVVTGRHHQMMEAVLAGYPQVQTVHNEQYETTAMFDSIRLGLQQVGSCDVLLFLPVDVPAIRPQTIQMLLAHWMKQKPDVLLPVYGAENWHPPVIAGRMIPALLQYDGAGGLRGGLESLCQRMERWPVPDVGCTMDADYPEDYQQLCRYWPVREIPDRESCRIFYQLAGTPEPVQAHCSAVAKQAEKLAGALAARGVILQQALLESAALLHDMCRTQAHHAQAGAELLRQYGCDAVAELVAVHMDWPEERPVVLDEAAVLYLADKLVSGDQNVPLSQRFAEKLARYAGEAEAVVQIQRRQTVALEILDLLRQIGVQIAQ